jgi:hypothetical protein
MALTGNWKASTQVEAGALKQGPGWNPIHAMRDQTGRNIAPNQAATSHDDVVPHDWDDPQFGPLDDPSSFGFGYGYENEDDVVFGYGPQSGTDDRPPYNVVTEQWRDNATALTETEWPEWGERESGVPGGDAQRHEDHGTLLSRRAKVRPTETVSEGWLNKIFQVQPNNPSLPDPSQLIMQTSMMQRDQTREGSQAAEGRASEFMAPIRSRIVGMRLKAFSGGQRHYDMQPREATEIIRPWWSRTAGTGDPDMLEVNDMRVREPITRTVPSEPDQGPSEPVVDHINYGFVQEDVIPYA